MRMTALDVQNHHFPRRFKGYDVDEVEQFRAALVDDWAALTAENDALRRRVQELEKRVEELDGHEATLRNALVTAQGMSDDLRRTAEHEAQMRVGQAELKAEKILAAAHRQTSRLAQDVRELRNLRSRMTASVRATIETHLALLEGFTQDHDDEFDPATERRLAALASPEPPPVGAEPDEAHGDAGSSAVHAAPLEPEPRTAEDDAAAAPPHAAGVAGPERRPLDSLVFPSGKSRASARPAPEGFAPAWTILPDQG